MLSYWNAGNRSSVDATDMGVADDETIVEPEQGNGKSYTHTHSTLHTMGVLADVKLWQSSPILFLS